MSLAIENDTVPFEIVSDPVPLRIDEGGAIRVGQTRVTLDTVVAAFNQGLSAEEIVWKFPTLNLADVYAVISYYLRRKEQIDTYLSQEEELIRQQYPEIFNTTGLRERLLARRAKQETAKDDKIPW